MQSVFKNKKKKDHMPSRQDKFRIQKNEKRRLTSQLPLEGPIRNAHRRGLTSWRRGLFSTAEAVSATPSNPILTWTTRRGSPVTYFCPSGLNENGFLVRWLIPQKKGVSYIAIFSAKGIVVCPATFVSQAHTESLTIPPPLSLCAYCSTSRYKVP